jgi:hypothetical protein
VQRPRFGDMVYSIARTREIAGEPWSPLIIRDVWVGVTRFDELQRDLGMSRKVPPSASSGSSPRACSSSASTRSDRAPRVPAHAEGLGHRQMLIAVTTRAIWP